MIKRIIVLIFKETLGFIVRFTGILFLIKLLNKKNEMYFVFNYHSFSKYNNYYINVGSILETGYKENFDKQVRFFKKHFLFKYPKEFFSLKEPLHAVLLTFDDGYKDNYDIAFPILSKHKIKSIFFIVSSLIDTNGMLMHDKIRLLVQEGRLDSKFLTIPSKINEGINGYSKEIIDQVNQEFKKLNIDKRNLMNTKEIKAIYEAGFKIGVHTHLHSSLSFLDYDAQRNEIENCLRVLEGFLGEINCIAYPNGLYNENTVKLNGILGIEYGFTTTNGFNTKTTNKNEIKRIGVNVSDSLNVISLKILGAILKNKKSE